MNELTEAEINGSLKEGICGIVNVLTNLHVSPKCLNYYGIEHFKTHPVASLTIVPTSEPAKSERKAYSRLLVL